MSADYAAFLASKSQTDADAGFAPTFCPTAAFDFQRALLEWSVRKGRAAVFADCGLGKSLLELAWAENVVRHTNGRVLVLTPLAVGAQMVREGEKFGVEARRHALAPGAGITVANYERLHHYRPEDFAGVVCDESGILKNFDGATRGAVVEFARTLPYRLLCTATPAPNDYVEMGNSSEALGQLGHVDMLNRFFKNDQNTSDTGRAWVNHGGGAPKWRFKGHAETPFWRWVCSWARALRRPSDLGPEFDDARFALPELIEREHVIRSLKPREGYLFVLPAHGLAEQREERRRTLAERCERAAALVADTGQPAVLWCNLNDEGDRLERLVPGAVQVSGADADEAKEEKFAAFESGQARVMVIKPAVGAWGLNWQHCAHMTVFAAYSFEQFYQSTRRLWRYGQTRPVVVDTVVSDGEGEVLANRQRKAVAADAMFARLVSHMREGMHVDRSRRGEIVAEIPRWL